MRAKYAARQKELEEHIYEIQDSSRPDCSCFNDLVALPSELPRKANYNAEYFYINLDREVLTMNFRMHWKLGHLPRNNKQWLEAIEDSLHIFRSAISLDLFHPFPDEYIASPALKLLEPNNKLGYRSHLVAAKKDISEARKVFLTRMLAEVMTYYEGETLRFGREWSAESFPFRELIFALVSIASGAARFFSFPAQDCNPRNCLQWQCQSDHLPPSCGFLDREWGGSDAPLLEFGSMSHRPGDAPGVAPPGKMFWAEDVLVSLTINVDEEAITRAVAWGLGQGRENFQMVVVNLYKVTFAEVYRDDSDDEKPMVKVTNPIPLSPLLHKYGISTHQRERPAFRAGMDRHLYHGELPIERNGTGTARQLQSRFPGLAALVNFFEVAASRRAASRSTGIFSLELYDLILDFVDYDTWKTCTTVSTGFRSSCLRKYRIDEETRIVTQFYKERLEHPLSFGFENLKTGNVLHATEIYSGDSTKELNWMPLIGSDRKALMLNVVVQFTPSGDITVENDGDSEVFIEI